MDDSIVKKPGNLSLLRIVALIAGIILIWSANYFGFWWFTILIGIIPGLLISRGRVAFLLSLLIGCLGWGGGLIYQSFFLPVTRTASLTAEIIGLGGAGGWIVIVVTLLLGALLCASSAWFSFASKSFVLAYFSSRAAADKTAEGVSEA